MSDTLRTRIIRLAHSRPDLRPHLLPLIASQDKVAARPLHEIAREIRSDWKPVDYAAKPYLEAMLELESVNDQYGADSGRYIVEYFLSNAGKWRGDVARRVKAELKQMVGRRASKEACGWDGGESDTKGCGEGTVMAKHEKGKSVDPTKDMSPEDAAEWKKQNAIHRDKFTKGASGTGRTAATLRMISDPGHGWLEVPVSDLIRLGISRKISQYSFRKGQMAYLEEDMDAGTYLEALDAAGEPRPDIVEVYQERTPIRNYPRYKGASGAGRTAGVIVDHNSIRRTYAPGVYDTWLLTDRARNGKKPQAAARQVLSQYRTQLSQMTAGDAVTFVDRKVMEMTGKVPDWHYYSMPD